MSRNLKSFGPAACSSFSHVDTEEDRFFLFRGVVDRIEIEWQD